MRLGGLLAIGLASTALAGPPSIETFAARPAVEGAAISPDGRYLATVETQAGRGAVIVREHVNGKFHGGKPVLGEPERFRIGWCRFATNTRLTRSAKPHRFVMIKDADHQLSAESARVTMLRECETFLSAYVPVGNGTK